MGTDPYLDELSQEHFDKLLHKIRHKTGKVTERDCLQLVQMLQRTYYGNDPVVSTFSKAQLIYNIDLICRAFSVTLSNGWKADPHYIISKLVAASRGLTSEQRKRIFVENHLHFGETISYWNRGGFAKYYLGAIDGHVALFISHEYGTNVMTATEDALKTIQPELVEMGFNIVDDNIPVFVKDDGDYYYKVQVDDHFENLKWTELDVNQVQWFEQQWKRFLDHGEHKQEVSHSRDETDEITFFRKRNPYTAYKHIRGLLSSTKKELFIIDPYLDAHTIAMMESVGSFVRIRWLYGKLPMDSKVVAKTFQDERGNFEYRKDKELHDRYMFCDDHGYLLGGSLNQFGNKPTTIVRLGDKRTVNGIKQYFEELWTQAE